ncbi:WD40 repeat-like protein [Mycena chlorophos]|uniref:WD40 repeat-like protein n=1 Tax=Mycena chlorophos TaxID=658473 RepID=A0A8H6VUB7_MYCCL|nr:WD40 repeat-like protein [Mycena chlorophos]
MTATQLPVLSVQHTFPEVISDVRSGQLPHDTFWLSCYTEGPGTHAKVRVTLDEVQRDTVKLESTLDFEVYEAEKNKYIVKSDKHGIPETPLFVPTHQYADPNRSNLTHPHRITAFDVAPDGSQFASGFLDGSVHTYSTAQKTPPVETSFGKIHKSTTSSLQFFPSSRVLLSAGADFTLCILPAEPSPTSSALAPVRTLMGHRRVITSTAIVSRGRNVVSASMDGTIRLWDVSSGAQIHLLTTGGSSGRLAPITSISLGERSGAAFPATERTALAPDSREVDTADKLLFCALQTKSFEAIDLGSRETVFSAPTAAPLTAISYSPTHNLLATGSNKGIVDVYDTRALSEGRTLASFNRGDTHAGIAEVTWVTDGTHLLVGTDDGLPFVARVGGHAPVSVAGELVGTDCDAVRSLRAVGSSVWTAADDGVVRRYDPVWS